MAQLKDLITKVFTFAYLAKDPTIVFAMDNDLWVPVRFLAQLEEFKILKAGIEDIVQSALELGFEYNAGLKVLRKKFSLPRTQVVVGGFSDVEEIKVALEKFDFISIQNVQGKDELLINCFCEEHAVEIALFLRAFGKNAVIEAVDTYLMLVSRAIQFVKGFQVIPFFFEPVRKEYSVQEVKEAYFAHVPVMPKEMQKCQVPVVVKRPVKFVNFND
jgi:hypothetical protein